MQDNNIAYCAVGDIMGLIIDFNDLERISYKQVTYEGKSHLLTACPNTLPYLKMNICFLIIFPSSYVKEIPSKSNRKLYNIYLNLEMDYRI